MIKRYSHAGVEAVWTNEAKLDRWGRVEVAVLQAEHKRKVLSTASYNAMVVALSTNSPDVEWWLAKDKEISHDLIAFIEERRRHLPLELRFLYHQHMTSYDTEEAAFAMALLACCDFVKVGLDELLAALEVLARRYRFTPFLDYTHGQWAKLRSFGGRMLTYIAELRKVREAFLVAREACRYSRLSGAIGNYGGGLSPELEKEALGILDFEPFYGATQIMPRVLYVPLAHSLADLAGVLNKIATDVRLGARSGKPICREPFGKKQKGSSAMPQKRNTILTEQMEGMERMARNFAHMIEENIKTWESRAIEQSCVERVAWPDIFHVLLRMLSVMTKVMQGLEVYPDHMYQQIVAARGTYAADEAKSFLGEKFAEMGVEAEEAYRVVQLASFCVFEPEGLWAQLRKMEIESLDAADALLGQAFAEQGRKPKSIQDFIRSANLCVVKGREVTEEEVQKWNGLLSRLFSDLEVNLEWDGLFQPSHLLKGENFLFQQILG